MSEYTSPEGIYYPSYEDYVFDQFGYANYSSNTRDFVVKVLQSLYNQKIKSDNDELYEFLYAQINNELEQSFIEFIHTILSHFDLVEYGTSPRYCWLTDKGFELLGPMFKETK